MLPALLSRVLPAALPTGPGPALALVAVALSYAISQREVHLELHVR